ncbi:MAG: DUF6273 domain-containing protein, partial [Clostridiales bacterium]|nr:DUF6273 domain-containing protein [Clostridiales bacterium]
MKSTKLYRIILGIVVSVMIFTLFGCGSSEEKQAVSINVYEYVEFGKYNGEPILWKCVDKSNGGMLVSEYVLCQKAFDAAENGTANEGSEYDVQKWGSNQWSNSNIREWLNSSSQTVSFTTQAPVKSAVEGGYNAYADEPGFLSNFTQSERGKIQAVSHEGVTDKVFLLSEDEVNKYVGSSDSQRKRKITYIGLLKSEHKYGMGGYYWWYWTRTPYPSYPYGVRSVDSSGHLYYFYANDGFVGVLPALNLQSDIFKSGKGTRDEPWKLN